MLVQLILQEFQEYTIRNVRMPDSERFVLSGGGAVVAHGAAFAHARVRIFVVVGESFVARNNCDGLRSTGSAPANMSTKSFASPVVHRSIMGCDICRPRRAPFEHDDKIEPMPGMPMPGMLHRRPK